jgi:hypothetical protein
MSDSSLASASSGITGRQYAEAKDDRQPAGGRLFGSPPSETDWMTEKVFMQTL